MNDTYDYQFAGDGSPEAFAGFLALMGAIWFVVLAVLIVVIIGMWKVFEKAGKPGWAAIIPIYNLYILLQIVGRPVWWLALLLLAFVPVLGNLVMLALGIVLALDLGKSFGKEPVFSILALWLFPVVGYPMLGFGKDKYLGPRPSFPQMSTVASTATSETDKTPPPEKK